jgi:hypothetical protein
MIDAAYVLAACEESLKSGPAASNPAIAACCIAFVRTFRIVLEKEKSNYEAKDAAAVSFCAALPPLAGTDNVRDFVACVAHGVLLHVIDEKRASRLLYAAQVARNMSPQSSKTAAS